MYIFFHFSFVMHILIHIPKTKKDILTTDLHNINECIIMKIYTKFINKKIYKYRVIIFLYFYKPNVYKIRHTQYMYRFLFVGHIHVLKSSSFYKN